MKRRTFLAATGATGAVAGLAACGGDDDGSSGSASTTLTLATVAAPLPWDLKDAGLGNNAIYYQPVYDPLLHLNAAGEVEENLATQWDYDDTATVLTLTLRTDVKFSDGTAFDATAVKANLENTKTGANEAATNIASIATVDAVDVSTVKITLSAPDPSLLVNLGNVSGMMASPKAIGTPALQTAPVGSGPYVLATSGTTAGSQYTFTRNANYWNAAKFPFDTIVFKYLSDPTALVNALRSGQVDGGQISDYKQAAPLKSAGLDVVEYVTGDVGGLYIWDRGGSMVPALGDVRVRKALNMAFDRDSILTSALGGLGSTTEQVFNPDSTAYDQTLNDTYSYDVAGAKALLAEAGYPNGFEVSMPDFSSFFPAPQAVITEALQAIGVTPKYETVPADQLINDLLGAKWPMSYFTLASFRSWDTVLIQVSPTALWNLFKYTDPKVEELIATAQNTLDETAQAAAFKELNDYMVDQAWNAPWDVVKANYVTSKKVTVEMRSFAPAPWIYDFTPAS
ncbi:ABC transporter substrate-binding protein [Kineococcus sp. NBC_00420]|uniref:ABC transporter substrate-binding protein n=1 Tax=Kineococcus sp. NBC_00420 TaxID=2903564 RepID=UPI002E1CC8C1